MANIPSIVYYIYR